jgi:hypothetical protein
LKEILRQDHNMAAGEEVKRLVGLLEKPCVNLL